MITTETRRIVVLIGKIRSGKSVVARYLSTRHGFIHIEADDLVDGHILAKTRESSKPLVIDACMFPGVDAALNAFLADKSNVEFWQVSGPGREIDDVNDPLTSAYLPMCSHTIDNSFPSVEATNIEDLHRQLDTALHQQVDAALKSDVQPGSRWQHTNGYSYEVLFLTNEHGTSSDYPIAVVYAGENGRKWSRPLTDWHRSMTRVSV
jgi:hypothetical protein